MDRRAQLRVVKSAVDFVDPEGLLAAGCPTDEYDTEASLIESRIAALSDQWRKHLGIEEIAATVAEVWGKQFGPFAADELQQRQRSFIAVAERISSNS